MYQFIHRRFSSIAAACVMSIFLAGCFVAQGPKIKTPIILLDLSLSTTAAQHSANIEDVTQLVGSYQGPAHITVLGITSSSYEKPLLLVREALQDDPKPLQPDLKKARARLIRKWKAAADSHRPFSKYSDVIGAICWAALQFRNNATLDQNLIIVSNMRHSTPELNLENKTDADVDKVISRLARAKAIPKLAGVVVTVVWSPDRGTSPAHREWLEEFWRAYFKRANVRSLQFIESGTAAFHLANAEHRKDGVE